MEKESKTHQYAGHPGRCLVQSRDLWQGSQREMKLQSSKHDCEKFGE